MIDAGGAAGGTNWASMPITQMAQLIRNPDTERHYELLTGWQRSADLVNEHRSQVQNYRDNLAAAWPPEKSAAAASYLARLDEMIASLNETYETAVANHDAFAAATLSISLAQKSFEKIYQEHEGNQQLLVDFEASQQKTSAALSTSLLSAKPPVPDGRQEQLRAQAALLLSTVSGDLAQAQIRIQRPTEYKRPLPIDENKEIVSGPYLPPVIPPITPDYADSGSPGGSSPRPPTSFPTSPSALTPPMVATPAHQPGLILGGANPPPPPPIATPPINIGSTPAPPLPPSGPPGPFPTPALFPPTTGNLPPAKGLTTPIQAPPGGGRGLGIPADGVIRPGGQIPEGMRAMPPGGLIGGVAGGGMGVGQPAPTRPSLRRVNPIGGVIGESPSILHGGLSSSSGTPGGTRGSSSAMPYGARGGRTSDHRDDAEPHWDPNNPWETAEGVDPVVRPAREQRIDPGPAIGLR
jgi:hypothetical protein